MAKIGEKVSVTKKAENMIRSLQADHGDLMFHQSGGCCDGSAPMCYPKGEFKVGSSDILLGEIEGCEFYMSCSQIRALETHALDRGPCKGQRRRIFFESPRGYRFLIRSKVL